MSITSDIVNGPFSLVGIIVIPNPTNTSTVGIRVESETGMLLQERVNRGKTVVLNMAADLTEGQFIRVVPIEPDTVTSQFYDDQAEFENAAAQAIA